MPVRTLRLAHGRLTTLNSFVSVYTCPAGRTAIVKDVRTHNDGTASSFVFWAVLSGPTSVRLLGANPNAGDAIFFTCFVVLEPGDQLQLFTASQPVNFHVSGAELAGVAP